MKPSPLQNRVTPFGELVATPERGIFWGNRGGRFHDPETKQLLNRHWASRAWIICQLEFNNRQRPEIMGPGFTEVFFLDEVTALAAGHRPCFQCRYKDAERFLHLHGQSLGLNERMKAAEFDRLAHASRLEGRVKKTYQAKLAGLPHGTMVVYDNQAYAVATGHLLRWSFKGYDQVLKLNSNTLLEVLTPQVLVDVLNQGYVPQWHETAERLS